MMDKRLTVIYADAAEKFVKNVVVYGLISMSADISSSLFYDPECTQLINGKDLLNLCQKGLIVEYAAPDGITYHETASGWFVGPYQNSDNPEIGFNVQTMQGTWFNPIINEEEVESEEEAE